MAAAAYATRFNALFQQYEKSIKNVENGIAHSTDVAVDLVDSLLALKEVQKNGQDLSETASDVDDSYHCGLLEESVKRYLDMIHEMHSQQRILEEMRGQLTAGQDVGDGDLAEYFEQRFEEEKQAWADVAEKDRYDHQEDYVEFKKRIWEKRHPNRPFSMGAADRPDEEDADDELAIVSQNESLICPLTQSLLEDPVTSQICKHSYSVKAINEHIRASQRSQPHGRAECPVAGCNKYVRQSDLKSNRSLARLAARRRAEAGDNEEEDEEEYTIMD